MNLAMPISLSGRVKTARPDDGAPTNSGDYPALSILDDHELGFERVAAKIAFLEPRTETFEACVRKVLGREAEPVLEKSHQVSQDLASGPGKLRHIMEIIQYIGDKKPAAAPGSHFAVHPLLGSSGKLFPVQELIEKPSLLFDSHTMARNLWPAERHLLTYSWNHSGTAKAVLMDFCTLKAPVE
ncbi:hypothetical protein GR223_05200 [Rhizobium leguminosarum]|uniref:hypothetical protein n=1 Tax=Rhizobium ruizarguesonis TaxID=2081791 RepID=UPI0014148609|nr:hypothetical protein [Rhizobium ruizarguesonis]NEJ85348.1 hypothetical protein [Rhizobium ruizarguesonis]